MSRYKFHYLLVFSGLLFIFNCLLLLENRRLKQLDTERISSAPSSIKRELDQNLIEFDTEEYNFGLLDYSEKAETIFTFTNIAKQKLFIDSVLAECGCTRVDWTREGIPPGRKGFITIEYDTRIAGAFYKMLNVHLKDRQMGIPIAIKGMVNVSSNNE